MLMLIQHSHYRSSISRVCVLTNTCVMYKMLGPVQIGNSVRNVPSRSHRQGYRGAAAVARRGRARCLSRARVKWGQWSRDPLSIPGSALKRSIGFSTGLLVLTGRPVNRPAGRPAKTIVLAGQKRPKLNISRNLHDFA